MRSDDGAHRDGAVWAARLKHGPVVREPGVTRLQRAQRLARLRMASVRSALLAQRRVHVEFTYRGISWVERPEGFSRRTSIRDTTRGEKGACVSRDRFGGIAAEPPRVLSVKDARVHIAEMRKNANELEMHGDGSFSKGQGALQGHARMLKAPSARFGIRHREPRSPRVVLQSDRAAARDDRIEVSDGGSPSGASDRQQLIPHEGVFET